jgi:uncharacterized protein
VQVPNDAIESRPFQEAAERGVLLLKRCVDTGRVFHYPREHSPFTAGATEWVEATGLGEIYACSVARLAKPPYCIAYIKLDEGPIVLSNIDADDLDAVAIGQRVGVVFRPDDSGQMMPFFTPQASGSQGA